MWGEDWGGEVEVEEGWVREWNVRMQATWNLLQRRYMDSYTKWER